MARPGEEPKLHLFGQLKRITKQWLDTCLVCKGGTYPAQLMYQELADMACERITAGITAVLGERPIKALLDPYNPTGSTMHVNFTTSKDPPLADRSRAVHVNWVVSTATGRPSSAASPRRTRGCGLREEPQPRLEVPYRYGSETRQYLPDFIVLVDDGHGDDDLLHLIVEIKGLPPRGRQGEEGHDGDLLGARREQPRPVWPLGLRRVHRGLSDRGRLQGEGRSRVQQDDRIRHVAPQAGRNKHMAKKREQTAAKTVERSTLRTTSQRKNIPTAEYQSVSAAREQSPIRVAYERRNRDLDPQLVWRGKDEQDWSDLVVHAPAALHPGEGPPQGADRRPAQADARAARARRRRTARPVRRLQRHPQGRGQDRVLPARPELVEPHDPGRLAPGDGEPGRARGLRGKVQCIYIDPPYGIKFNCNFQWSNDQFQC